MIPSRPIESIRAMMFGSISTSSARFHDDICTSVTSALAVWSTMPFGTVFWPSISFRRAGRVGAIVSITFSWSASRAVRLEARRTAASAHLTLRPCSFARPRSDAAASFTTLRRRSRWMSSPPTEIGVEEPMFVCGAIARMSPAWPIQTPAEAALAPSGET